MRRFYTLLVFLFLLFSAYAQNISSLMGIINSSGSSVSAASSSAQKAISQLATSGSSGAAASQLQMLGLDPNIIQKYIQKSEQPKNNANNQVSAEDDALPNPIADILGILMSIKTQQDDMSTVLAKLGIQDSTPAASVSPDDIYGHDFFGNQKLATFVKSTDARAADSYILDSGDELNIAVWGYADYNNKFKVNDDGYIQIPEFGRIYVRGLTFGAVKALIGKRLSTFIDPKNTKYEISLIYSRTIDVNIVGEVKSPGTYQIPAINSVYNAINAANGITDIGSVRDIQIRRNGKVVKTFDVYEFLFNPLSDNNFYLQKGDFIFIGTQEKLLKIGGAVRRPAKYELKKSEGLKNLVKFAGGFSPDANTKSLQIVRNNGKTQQIIDVNYDLLVSSGSDFVLNDGDIVNILSVTGDPENFVKIEGQIKYPGKYELKEGYRISDIIIAGGGITSDAYLDRAYIKRKLPDNTYINQKFSLKDIILNPSGSENLLLQKEDEIKIFSKNDFLEKFKVTIAGSVINPLTMDYTRGMTLNDLLFYAGGLKMEAANSKIEISRNVVSDTVKNEFSPQRITVLSASINDKLEIDEKSKSFLLEPFDQVYVRKTPGFNSQESITINGEVMYPGIYPILDKNEKVLDLIRRTGGLTPYAYLNGATLVRLDNNQQEIIFELKNAFKDSTSRANLVLKNGDVINIPTVNQQVSIKGNGIRYPDLDSNQTISGKFIPGKSARWYIKNYAGGFKKGANKRSTYVMYPNKKMDYTRFAMGIKNYPTVDYEGAVINVDMKVKKPKPPKGPESNINWNILLPSIIAGITSLGTTLTLIFVLKN